MVLKIVGALAVMALGGGVAGAEPAAKLDDTLYVKASTLNARLCPEKDCPIAAKLPRGTTVSVFERKGDWTRITAYYPAADEKRVAPDIKEDRVARWVASEFLSKTKPKPLITGARRDRRIYHMPRVGEGGLTAAEVRMLYRYAKRLLDSGACESITTADKSRTRPGTYFVTCGNEYGSRFFRPGDVR